MLKWFHLGSMLFCFLCLPSQASANLLLNGSFETSSANPTETDGLPYYRYTRSTTSVDGWIIGGSSLAMVESRPPYWSAADGNRYINLESSYGYSIEQSLSTIIGAQYVIRFAYAPDALSTGGSDSALRFLWDGAIVADVSSFDSTFETLDWTYFEYTLTATESTSVIRFEDGGVGTPYIGPYLDDVSVMRVGHAVPEPSTLPLVLGGLGAWCFALTTRRARLRAAAESAQLVSS